MSSTVWVVHNFGLDPGDICFVARSEIIARQYAPTLKGGSPRVREWPVVGGKNGQEYVHAACMYERSSDLHRVACLYGSDEAARRNINEHGQVEQHRIHDTLPEINEPNN